MQRLDLYLLHLTPLSSKQQHRCAHDGAWNTEDTLQLAVLTAGKPPAASSLGLSNEGVVARATEVRCGIVSLRWEKKEFC